MDMLYLQTLLHRYHMLEPYIYTSRPCHQNAIEPSTLFNQVSQRVERVHFWVFLIGAITISGVRIYAITIHLFRTMPLQFV